jgi:hypothetical protein
MDTEAAGRQADGALEPMPPFLSADSVAVVQAGLLACIEGELPGGIAEEQPQLLERVPVLLDLIGHGLAVSLSLHRQLFQCQGIPVVVIVGAGGLSREAVNGDTDEETGSGRVANVDDALAHLENIDIAVKAEPRLVLRDDEIGSGPISVAIVVGQLTALYGRMWPECSLPSTGLSEVFAGSAPPARDSHV